MRNNLLDFLPGIYQINMDYDGEEISITVTYIERDIDNLEYNFRSHIFYQHYEDNVLFWTMIEDYGLPNQKSETYLSENAMSWLKFIY
jgi:hypothetical protein